MIVKRTLPRNDDGTLSSFAWPGGYPLFYLDCNGNELCPDCANEFEKTYRLDVLTDICRWCSNPNWNNPDYDDFTVFLKEDMPVAADVNYEGHLYCDVCSHRIEAAYTEEDEA